MNTNHDRTIARIKGKNGAKKYAMERVVRYTVNKYSILCSFIVFNYFVRSFSDIYE